MDVGTDTAQGTTYAVGNYGSTNTVQTVFFQGLFDLFANGFQVLSCFAQFNNICFAVSQVFCRFNQFGFSSSSFRVRTQRYVDRRFFFFD